MSDGELTRIIDIRHIGNDPVIVEADENERKALARRFGLVSVDALRATVVLQADAVAVTAKGRIAAKIVQSCAVSGADLPVTIEDALSFRFVAPRSEAKPDEEIEIDEDDCDEIEFTGQTFDLGEAVAQSLALAIDPYATGPDAEDARRKAGIVDENAPSGPFAALAGLKKPE